MKKKKERVYKREKENPLEIRKLWRNTMKKKKESIRERKKIRYKSASYEETQSRQNHFGSKPHVRRQECWPEVGNKNWCSGENFYNRLGAAWGGKRWKTVTWLVGENAGDRKRGREKTWKIENVKKREREREVPGWKHHLVQSEALGCRGRRAPPHNKMTTRLPASGTKHGGIKREREKVEEDNTFNMEGKKKSD